MVTLQSRMAAVKVKSSLDQLRMDRSTTRRNSIRPNDSGIPHCATNLRPKYAMKRMVLYFEEGFVVL